MVRMKPGPFDLFVVTVGITIPLVFGLNCIQPLPSIGVIGILLIVAGVVIVANEKIPWGRVPT